MPDLYDAMLDGEVPGGTQGGGFGGLWMPGAQPEEEPPVVPVVARPPSGGVRRLSLPVRYDNGRLASVAQGSAADVDQRVVTLLAFRPGQRLGSEEFGAESVHFEQVPNLNELAQTVVRWDAAADAAVDADGRSMTGIVQQAVLRIADDDGGTGG